MSIFKPYNGYLYELKRAMKAGGVKLRQDKVPEELISLLGKMVPNGGHIGQNGVLVLLEYIHYCFSHQVYFIKSDFAKRLAESKMEIRLDELHIPHKIFEICFEDDLEIDGIKIPSCLAGCSLGDVEINIIKDTIKKLTGQKEVPVGGALVNAFTVRMPSPWDGGMLHVMADAKSSHGKNIDTVIDELGEFELEHMEKLDNKELDLEKIISRIALGVICYLNTSDPVIADMKPSNRPILGIRPQIQLVGDSVDANWHIRRAHWRFLKDERYRRDDSGKVRCVWVRSAEVNRGGNVEVSVPKVDVLPKEENDG
jgi:hypothetical protein